MQYLLNKVLSFANDCCKSNGYHCKTTWLCRTSSRRSICLHSGKNGGRSKIAQTSEVRMSIYIWIRLPRHKWPKSWSTIEDPMVHLERNLYGHRLAGLVWERHFEEVLLELGWEKVPNWECLFCSSKTECILFGIRGWHQNDWKKAEFESPVEEIGWNMLILTNQLHFLTTFI